MLSPNQRRLYWRAWGALCRVLGWGRRAVLDAGPKPHGWGAAARLHDDVWRAAGQITRGRPLTPDAMRHALHRVVLGRDISHIRLTNAQFDLILAAFRLLANPADIAAAVRLEHPQDDTRRRRIWAITHTFDRPYWEHICRCWFGHADLDALTNAQLADLHAVLKKRQARRAKNTQQHTHPHTQHTHA